MTSLLEHQLTFASLLPDLLSKVISLNLRCKLGECLRSDEQALINAIGFNGRTDLATHLEKDPRWHGLALAISNNGRANGILMSVHRLALAVDLNLFTPAGLYLSSEEDHRPLGEWWEGQHISARWGGRFGDGNHYSFEWAGVK